MKLCNVYTYVVKAEFRVFEFPIFNPVKVFEMAIHTTVIMRVTA